MRNKNVRQINRGRITLGFAIISVLFVVLSLRLAKIMIIDSDDLTQRAISQQTRDTTIEAKRGIIYDRNGKELATSTICYTLYAFPGNFTNEKTDAEIEENIKKLSEVLGATSEKDIETLTKQLTAKDGVITLRKHLSKEDADNIRKLKLKGLELAQATMRYYPLGNFASQVLGSVNDDGEGRTGLELQYDDYLSGVNGSWVNNTDISGNELVEGTERHYAATDGYNVVTTIDEAIQYYCEETAKSTYDKWSPKKVEVLAMDPKTGEILASVVYPGYDPNSPSVPQNLTKEEKEKFDALSDSEKTDYLSRMWRNPIISDTYEPGSTFKLITAASAIDEKAISLTETFSCYGSFRVEDYTMRCWINGAHGAQTIKQAIANSCNPALASVARKLGATRFKQYINDFGFSGYTGVDYPGEATALIQSYIGPVELATMGFGQGISITPIQLVTAISAITNGGNLVQPHYVKALTDSEGKIVKTFDTQIERKVISPSTSKEMRNIMQYEVEHGSGTTAIIDGYSIGGKTGTAQKAVPGGYSKYDYYASFVCVAPMEDPQIALLVVVDTPKGSIYGATVAAPAAKKILKNVLRYMAISPSSETETKNKGQNITVPDLTGKTYKQAEAILKERGLKVLAADGDKGDGKWKVVDQYPKPKTKVSKKTTVYLYKE